MGNRKKADRPGWHENAAMSVLLLKECAHLITAISVLVQIVNSRPL